MEVKRKIKCPILPNFVFLETDNENKHSIPITSFSHDEMYEFAEFLKQEFIKHYNKKINNKEEWK